MEKKKMSFEEALARLEEIVEEMESGKAALDDMLALFEEGVSLVKLCNSKLDSAERKIKLVKGNEEEIAFDGVPEEER